MNTVRFFWGTGEIGAVFVALRVGHEPNPFNLCVNERSGDYLHFKYSELAARFTRTSLDSRHSSCVYES